MKSLKLSSLFNWKGACFLFLVAQTVISYHLTVWASNNLTKVWIPAYSGIESFGDYDGWEQEQVYFSMRYKEVLRWNIFLLSCGFFSWAAVVVSLRVLFHSLRTPGRLTSREKLEKDYDRFINLVLLIALSSLLLMMLVVTAMFSILFLEIAVYIATGIRADTWRVVGEYGEYAVEVLSVLQCFGFGALATFSTVPIWLLSIWNTKSLKRAEEGIYMSVVVVRLIPVTRLKPARKDPQKSTESSQTGNHDEAIQMA